MHIIATLLPRLRRHSAPLAALMVLVQALLLGACGTAPDKKAAEVKLQTIWPEPPDEPRFVYETALRSLADIRPESDEQRLRRQLTGEPSISSELVYKKPSAVAARKGRIYIADPPQSAIVVFDVPRRTIYRMGMREPNPLSRPVALAIDGKDFVYALDGKLRKVMVFDALGLFQFSVGDPEQLTHPSGVAVSADGQKIFVVDRGSLEGDDHKVIAYAPDGKELFRLGPRGVAPGQFNIPLAATVTADDRLLVLDSGNFRVQAFDLEGKHRLSFGGVGTELGRFSRPRSITTDKDGNIYVGDASFNNVQIFSAAGELLMWIGKAVPRDGPGHFQLIGGITVDETGRLYIIDHYFTKIEVYRRATPAHAQTTAR